MPKRLKANQVSDVTQKLLKMQSGKCAVCGHYMTLRDRPVLDHDHTSGFIRGVLHNSCNGAEGKVRVKAQRGHTGVSPEKLIIGLGKYLDKHSKPQTQLLHPSHLTGEEKRIKRNKRATVLRKRRKAVK